MRTAVRARFEQKHREYEKSALDEIQVYRDLQTVEERRRIEGKPPKVRFFDRGGAAGVGTAVPQTAGASWWRSIPERRGTAVKLHLLRQLLDLNQAFENVVRGLERMEKVTLFHKEQLRYTRAEIETARADANREFFDKFGEMVEQDAKWADKFCREYDRKTRDPYDLYFEIKEREEARRKKGLPPRVVLLPDWDKDDEERYDKERAKKRSVNMRRKAARNPKSSSMKAARQVQTSAVSGAREEQLTHGEDANQLRSLTFSDQANSIPASKGRSWIGPNTSSRKECSTCVSGLPTRRSCVGCCRRPM